MSKYQKQAENNVKEMQYQLNRLTVYFKDSHDPIGGSTSIQVPSFTGSGVDYTVSRVVKYFCTCPDFVQRGGYMGVHLCKHIDEALSEGTI